MLSYVLDEQLRGPLWSAIQRHNSQAIHPLNAVRVGGPAGLPLGTPDPALLLWAEREDRVPVSMDWKTLAGHLAHHLQTGHHSPGIFSIRRRRSLAQIVDHLVLAAYASLPDEWRDRIEFIP